MKIDIEYFIESISIFYKVQITQLVKNIQFNYSFIYQ